MARRILVTRRDASGKITFLSDKTSKLAKKLKEEKKDG
jgi:hypothetical protein